ncbi:MAG: acyltransferase family protein [Candidatus Schekmanbacteria bacterium]|nr:acyltransferase family protein [Candidatus Schekmanbacteria bacterium]
MYADGNALENHTLPGMTVGVDNSWIQAALAARDVRFIRRHLPRVRAVSRYFRGEVHGIDNIPASGPALIVGNHNGLMQPAESWVMTAAIWDRFGAERELFFLGHDMVFRFPAIANPFRKSGAIPAHPEVAATALRRGALVVVYPGGDVDACRPFSQRHRIVFAGRMGFIRLAIECAVPIVPAVSVGAHETVLILSDGRRLARRLGFKRLFRSEVLPLALSFPWGLTIGPTYYFPLPAKVEVEMGAPIDLCHLPKAAAREPETVTRCYGHVVDTMQKSLDRMASGRRWPIIG